MEAGGLTARVGATTRSVRASRLRARLPRYLAFVALGIVCLVGVVELVSAEPTPRIADPAGERVDAAAEGYAVAFARAYFDYDPLSPEVRERALNTLVPSELSDDAGYVPTEAQEVEWAEIVQNQEALAGGRVIVVATKLDIREQPVYLGVPVDRDAQGRLWLTAYPSVIGAPALDRAGSLPAREPVEEPAVLSAVERAIENYLAGSAQNLAADLATDAEVSLPANPMRVVAIESVEWASGPESGAALVTVEARDRDGALWTLTYEVGLDTERGRTVLTFIETIPTAP